MVLIIYRQRLNSYKAAPAAMPTLSDSFWPSIGIEIMASANFRTVGVMPLISLPTIKIRDSVLRYY